MQIAAGAQQFSPAIVFFLVMFIQVQAPSDPFATYVPSEAEPWNVQRVGHLLRRVAFGSTWKRQQDLLKLSPAEAVDSLLNFDSEHDPFEGMLEQMTGL